MRCLVQQTSLEYEVSVAKTLSEQLLVMQNTLIDGESRRDLLPPLLLLLHFLSTPSCPPISLSLPFFASLLIHLLVCLVIVCCSACMEAACFFPDLLCLTQTTTSTSIPGAKRRAERDSTAFRRRLSRTWLRSSARLTTTKHRQSLDHIWTHTHTHTQHTLG